MSAQVSDGKLNRVVKLLELLSYLGGLVGLLLIWQQLTIDARERRIAQTLQLVDRFSSEPLSTYRATLLRVWLDRADDLAAIRSAGGVRPEDARILVSAALAEHHRTTPSDQVYVAIHELADFYDQLAICIDSGICNRDVARNYFTTFADEFSCLYDPIIREQASLFNTPALGRGLQRIRSDRFCRQAVSGQ